MFKKNHFIGCTHDTFTLKYNTISESNNGNMIHEKGKVLCDFV